VKILRIFHPDFFEGLDLNTQRGLDLFGDVIELIA
jgi:hypothetical protein